jgi:hypothetical protein
MFVCRQKLMLETFEKNPSDRPTFQKCQQVLSDAREEIIKMVVAKFFIRLFDHKDSLEKLLQRKKTTRCLSICSD